MRAPSRFVVYDTKKVVDMEIGDVYQSWGIAVINGFRQRCVAGIDALDHGYNPARRSLVWTIGDSLIKGAGKDSKYRKYYDDRKAYEIERNPDMAKIHAHNRAKRYMEAKLLRDLYYACRA